MKSGILPFARRGAAFWLPQNRNYGKMKLVVREVGGADKIKG